MMILSIGYLDVNSWTEQNTTSLSSDTTPTDYKWTQNDKALGHPVYAARQKKIRLKSSTMTHTPPQSSVSIPSCKES